MKGRYAFIPLAWPETKVVAEGKWYDVPMKWLGFLKDGYYKVGHAAFLTVSMNTGEVLYFDFGRYQTPKQHGRVRSVETDPELQIQTSSLEKEGQIVNIERILQEVSGNKSTHGTGRIVASIYYDIDFIAVKSLIQKWQNQDFIPYGPFKIGGTNCSRFVASAFRAGNDYGFNRLKLYLPYTISSTPMSNVNLIGQKVKNPESTPRINTVEHLNYQYS